MRLRSILLLLVCILMVLSVGFAQQTQAGKPKMVIEQATYDAGTMYRGGEKNFIEHDFVIKNTGTANLEILKAKPG